MKKPEPRVGLVIRYDFLWSRERDRGLEHGAKDRPCVIVVAVLRRTTGETDILVAPITHSTPREGEVAIEIPPGVGRSLGLDDKQSYIVADEVNAVSWGDAGIVPAVPGVRWAYGRIPKSLYGRLRAAMLDLVNSRRLKSTDRNG